MQKTILLLATFSLLLAACGGKTTPAQPPAASVNVPLSQSPQAWVDAPLNSATLPLGEIEIISHAAGPGGIAQVELSVDGVVVRSDPNPSKSETLSLVRQKWLPRAGGTYLVTVRAQNISGDWSAPASVTLTILDAPPTLALAPSETPTLRPSETPTPSGPLTIVLVRNSFCRAGPGQVYREITALATGDNAEVRGVSQDSLWLFVYWPKFQVECWIVSAAAPPDTNLTGVPVLAAPPTPVTTDAPTLEPTATDNFKP
jgi:hypothetical protein